MHIRQHKTISYFLILFKPLDFEFQYPLLSPQENVFRYLKPIIFKIKKEVYSSQTAFLLQLKISLQILFGNKFCIFVLMQYGFVFVPKAISYYLYSL